MFAHFIFHYDEDNSFLLTF